MRISQNTLILSIVLAVLNLGISLSWLFIGIYIYEISQNLLWVSLFYSIPQLAWILGSVFWGYIADIYLQRKQVLSITSFLFGVFMLFFAFFEDPFILVILFSVAYFFAGARAPSINAYVTSLEASKGRAMGKVIAASSIGWALGGLFSGVLYEYLNPFFLYIFSGSLMFFVSLLSVKLTEPKRNQKRTKQSGWSIYFRLLRNKYVAFVCAIGFLLTLAMNIIMPVFSVYLVDGLGGTPFQYALASSIGSLSGFFVSMAIGKLTDHPKFGKLGAFLYSIFGYIIFFYLISLGSLLLALIGWMLPAYAGFLIAGPAMIAEHTDDEIRSRGMGLLDAIQNIGVIIGYIATTIMIIMLNINDIVFALLLVDRIALAITFLSLLLFIASYLYVLKGHARKS
ncbi:MAG: MFS transporter [Candidatus Asgardarchaeia archaeon]